MNELDELRLSSLFYNAINNICYENFRQSGIWEKLYLIIMGHLHIVKINNKIRI